jgi:selenocysteine lyase/cysteine desulfurase
MADAAPSGPHDGALRDARAQFSHPGVYLDTASIGLPPRRTLEALEAELDRWRDGLARPADYDPYVADARNAYATLVGVAPGQVAIGPQVSVFAGVIAASLPAGSQVLTARDDFTSILFPFHVQPGIEVREVPLGELAGAVSQATRLVAVSAVQSRDGTIADLESLRDSCASSGSQILLDTTQAVGWLPIEADQYAYTVAAGYKWLLTPRGTAYMTVQNGLLDGLIAANAGWYAGADPWDSIYGTPLRLAEDARRLDVSPAWHSWVGAVPSLELIGSIGRDALRTHCVAMANRFREGAGLPPGDSAILTAKADASAAALMRAEGIAGSVRAARLRLSFHICTDADDVDRACEVLDGHISP